jgi:Tfp pilus assembly protein PilO
MSMTDRDKKIIVLLVPLLAVLGYWFLVLAPKRKEASQIGTELTQAQSKRDSAQSQLSHLMGAKNSFATDYATVIRLGKSVPTNLDMASLMVQLNSAAKGTGIEFTKVDAGQRSAAPAAGSTPPGGGQGVTAPGAPPAQSGTGKTAQNAANNVNSANAQNGANAAAANGTGGANGSTGAAGAGGQQPSSSGAAGLDSIPLNFEFTGNFFNLADFFHRVKRFVRVVNDQIQVNGRLLTIDSLNFDATQTFPNIKANVTATVYLTPAAQGVTDGATPQGPATTPASTGSGGSSSPSTPTATVTP